MPVRGLSDRLKIMLASARRLWHETQSDAVLLFVERPLDWEAVREKLGHCKLLVASPYTVPGDSEPNADEAPISTDPPDRKSTRLNSSHIQKSRMPSSA